jgi:hypothetical protein
MGLSGPQGGKEQDKWADDVWETDDAGERIVGGAPPNFQLVAASALSAVQADNERLRQGVEDGMADHMRVVGELANAIARAEAAEARLAERDTALRRIAEIPPRHREPSRPGCVCPVCVARAALDSGASLSTEEDKR